MTESMVERVARAICEGDGYDTDRNNLQDPRERSEGMKNWQRYVHQARAAIEAMREPTKLMARVGLRENTLQGAAIWPDQAWNAMIDAALSPSAEKET